MNNDNHPRQERYKTKPIGFRDADTGRLVRTVKHEERRKVQRAENYAKHRNVPEARVEESEPKPLDIEKKLERWRAEREIQKKIEKQKKRPAFKVGVVHHKFYSPPVPERKNIVSGPCHQRAAYKVKHLPTPPKRITRATQKRLEAKVAGASVAKVIARPTTAPLPTVRRPTKKRLPSMTKEVASSFAPVNYSFKAPSGLAEIPLFGRFAVPNGKEADEPTTENGVEPDRDKDNEIPWPRANNPPVDIMASPKIRRSFGRQNAIERLSPDSLEALSRGNSSIEAFTLRLSSEDESPAEANSPKINAKKTLKFSETEETNDYGVANAVDDDAKEDVEKIDDAEDNDEMEKMIESADSTPPRSGTPVPASFSPYIVSSRGKDSARREQSIKMGVRRSSANEIPTKDTVMQNLNISVEEEEQTAQYFKFLLQREIDRLTELCNKWEVIMNEPDLTEDARYQINQAVGQTNLLIRKKFERFRRLVLDCETGKGEMLVQCKDLQGFWDMMYMEVKDCESRFLKLEFLRSKGWLEEQPPVAVTSNKVTRKKVAAAPAGAVKPKINAKSSARSWILAARKKKLLQQEDQDADEIIIATKNAEPRKSNGATEPLNQRDENASRDNPRQSSIFENSDRRQSMAIATPRKTPTATPRKTPTSLRKQVQLSQASKSVRSPLTIMKISKMCRTPKVELDDTISYVNSHQTPGKGILKKSDDSSSQESCPPKSARKVDFNDTVFLEEVAVENDVSPELQNSLDLGRALAKIDLYEADKERSSSSSSSGSSSGSGSDGDDNSLKNITLRNVKNRLDFENDWFDETENTDTGESAAAAIPESPEVPVINVVPATPASLKTAKSSANTTSRRSSRRVLEESINKVAEQLEEDPEQSFRVLRNRTVTVVTPSKSNRRSMRSFSGIGKNNSILDSSTKENSDPLGGSKKGANSEASNGVDENAAGENHVNRRRSTRKSVRFNADDCTACAPKPTLPMTPHSRRSRKSSLLGKISRESVVPTSNDNLISLDSPAKLPARIRRSSCK